MLKLSDDEYYRVKKGDSAAEIAIEHGCPLGLLCRINALKGEVEAGDIIIIPRGILHTVEAGDGKKKLCGSEEKYREMNGTDCFFIGMKVFVNSQN